jgi:hypothetical protein
MREFHHYGMPTTEKQPGEVYVEATKVWVTDPLAHPLKIEYLRYEPDSPVTGILHDMPHIAFKTDDLRREIEGLEIIAPPFKPMADLTVVFVMKDGALFEFMQWD